ncbi:MAG: helix-turn-helix transcriptional regulator [Oscillospiraceae bacterium]|nr:helix-turn-helix transcriptional regulator [Oscillospiraceae bacterium]
MFGHRLRRLRKRMFLSQAALGKLLGLSTSAIGMYEQGHREPDYHILQRVCKLFNVSADYMVNTSSDHTIFFNPDIDHDFIKIINNFTSSLQKQNRLYYKDRRLDKRDIEKLSDAINMAVNYYFTSNNIR